MDAILLTAFLRQLRFSNPGAQRPLGLGYCFFPPLCGEPLLLKMWQQRVSRNLGNKSFVCMCMCECAHACAYVCVCECVHVCVCQSYRQGEHESFHPDGANSWDWMRQVCLLHNMLLKMLHQGTGRDNMLQAGLPLVAEPWL